ncbi:MAG: sigma-70 family RNA polymerase sigma factor, partial [Phycisphaerales bacterium]|nr:sigma-70 family RNA polymerase sigma factor [Phycisphaerales bacterium]
MADAERTLVQAAQRGDRAAFEELVRRMSRLVFARLYLETGDTHQAEDLLQDTLLTAYRNIDQLIDPGTFRGWLMRIAQNKVIDHGRKNQRRRQHAEDDSRIVALRPHADRPEAPLEREEMRQKVLAVLRGLPEEYRLPLTLRYLTGADYESIQMQMGLSNG